MSFKCRKCNTELPDDAAYCTSCGAKQDRDGVLQKLTGWAMGSPKQVVGLAVAVMLIGVGVLTMSNNQSAASVTDTGKKEEKVWVADGGHEYHSDPNCSNIKDPKQITLDQAEKDGYEPCKKCY